MRDEGRDNHDSGKGKEVDDDRHGSPERHQDARKQDGAHDEQHHRERGVPTTNACRGGVDHNGAFRSDAG